MQLKLSIGDIKCFDVSQGTIFIGTSTGLYRKLLKNDNIEAIILNISIMNLVFIDK